MINKWTFDPLSGCWPWLLSTNSKGYGRVRVDGVEWRAHRWVYEQLIGRIPPGLTLDHWCENKSCVNPSHMEPCTAVENLKRAAERAQLAGRPFGKHKVKKSHCKNGHQFSQENTRTGDNGYRKCLTCVKVNNDRNNAKYRKGH